MQVIVAMVADNLHFASSTNGVAGRNVKKKMNLQINKNAQMHNINDIKHLNLTNMSTFGN